MNSYKKQKKETLLYSKFKIKDHENKYSEILYTKQINDNISENDFFENYIKKRKPVKFRYIADNINEKNLEFKFKAFKPKNLIKTLNFKDEIKVEEKENFGFGNKKKKKITIEELFESFENSKGKYYLTTQYSDDSSSNESDIENESYDSLQSKNSLIQNQEFNKKEIKQQENTENNSNNSSESEIFEIDDCHDDFNDYASDESFIDNELKLTYSEATDRLKSLFQKPLTNLAVNQNILPIEFKLFKNLILQQINIWIGSIEKKQNDNFVIDKNVSDLNLGKYIPGPISGTSSGLHHDYADNLYFVISGRKRFTIFDPSSAPYLYTHGNISTIYENGVINYKNEGNYSDWKCIRSDGAILEEVLSWKLSKFDCVNEKNLEKKKLLEQLNSLSSEKINDDSEKLRKKNDVKNPINFSKISPTLLHIDDFENDEDKKKLSNICNKHFPGFLNLKKYTIYLETNDILYLPAGWFHEVTSFSSDNNSDDKFSDVHIAINYWFNPPDNDEFENPYKDDYWVDDWKRSNKSIELLKQGKIKFL